jgi:hypothetical protein
MRRVDQRTDEPIGDVTAGLDFIHIAAHESPMP